MIGVDTEFAPHPVPTASQAGTHPQWTPEYRSNARGMRGAHDLNVPPRRLMHSFGRPTRMVVTLSGCA